MTAALLSPIAAQPGYISGLQVPGVVGTDGGWWGTRFWAGVSEFRVGWQVIMEEHAAPGERVDVWLHPGDQWWSSRVPGPCRLLGGASIGCYLPPSSPGYWILRIPADPSLVGMRLVWAAYRWGPTVAMQRGRCPGFAQARGLLVEVLP